MAGKGKLTIGIMLGKKPGMGPRGDAYDEKGMEDGEEKEGQTEELPEGLVEAVQEMRIALESGEDEDAARALMNAISLCC
jgi:hypothetical protein